MEEIVGKVIKVGKSCDKFGQPELAVEPEGYLEQCRGSTFISGRLPGAVILSLWTSPLGHEGPSPTPLRLHLYRRSSTWAIVEAIHLALRPSTLRQRIFRVSRVLLLASRVSRGILRNHRQHPERVSSRYVPLLFFCASFINGPQRSSFSATSMIVNK